MDGDDKDSVRTAMRAHVLRAGRATAGDERTDEHAAELDPGAQYTVDDLSQSDDAGAFVALDGEVLAAQSATVAAIDALDFGPMRVVGPGAIVEFDGERYVIGAAVSEFTAQGVSYSGISTDAPIYAAIAGLHAGDEFSFRGVTYHIDAVR
ncbi:MAG TPA: hypothetical protein VJR25_06100 [Microbacterium sp.]|uniref:hypothetical protein n=1 Tax=Microbacterium sp. TaxID=51671 RepID=UPI002B497375|nr:hypothetical protein [Microbacterium sp.]HKT56327.1 hypothetical protein [Microbacterium sp.]